MPASNRITCDLSLCELFSLELSEACIRDVQPSWLVRLHKLSIMVSVSRPLAPTSRMMQRLKCRKVFISIKVDNEFTNY